MNLRRLFAIIVKELRQLRRDRLTFAMIIGIPTMQLVLFGFAINLDVRHLDAAIVDQANTARSRELVAALQRHRRDRPPGRRRTRRRNCTTLLRERKISVGIVLPRTSNAASNGATAPRCRSSSTAPTRRCRPRRGSSRRFRLPAQGGATYQGVEVVNFYNPERRAAVNTVPGLIGVILTMTMVMFTAMALVRERERGNLEMLIATPVSPWELTIGKVLPFVGIGLVQTTVVLPLGKLVFCGADPRHADRSLRARRCCSSSPACRSACSSRRSRSSQFQAMQMAFFTFLPQILLSGFMFPFAGMPRRGAVGRRDPAADPFPAADPRHHAARRRARRPADGHAGAGIDRGGAAGRSRRAGSARRLD